MGCDALEWLLQPGAAARQLSLARSRATRLTALGELLRRWNNIEIDPALADRLRDELAADDGRTILAAVLAGIPREFERLRAEMAELRAFAQRAGVQSTGSAAGAQPARGLPL
jgi:hypothetical protein